MLFVAHREEILNQAAETFVRIRPRARVGFYKGQVRDAQVDVLCASVQTLGQNAHLERFSPRHFDYLIIDEFHHAAAPTYRRLLAHFVPQFLLGLTATPDRTELPYFPNPRIACGHFRTARADAEEYRRLGPGHGRLDPARHFIARAAGNSMNGGKHPIQDGDYLLLELVSPANAGSITGTTMAIERQDQTGDDQYLLRVVTKNRDGSYVLVANNPDHDDLHVTPELASELRTLARFKAVLEPLELAIGEAFMREDIPTLFHETFNPGNWNSGHVVLPDQNAHVLLVTLNKQGKAQDHRYLDHWIDDHTFHWQRERAPEIRTAA